jgi:prolyl 4-hydroxylase
MTMAVTVRRESTRSLLNYQGSFQAGPQAAPAVVRKVRTEPDRVDLGPGSTTADRLASQSGMQRIPTPRAELCTSRNFLNAEECAALIDLIESQHRPSTLANSRGELDYRTSETCDLDGRHPTVALLEAKLTQISGIPATYGEGLQGQRYEVGQEFKAHTDYFEPDHSDYDIYCKDFGQRTWTFMIYLNDVEAGGATRFKVIDKIFQPEQGRLLAWNNRRPDGSLNPATLHHAMKVRQGMKYVITRWYRERPCRAFK